MHFGISSLIINQTSNNKFDHRLSGFKLVNNYLQQSKARNLKQQRVQCIKPSLFQRHENNIYFLFVSNYGICSGSMTCLKVK